MEPTHIALADESRYTAGQYRAVGVVSLRLPDKSVFDQELGLLLETSNVRELSWKAVTSARDRMAAMKALHWALRQAADRKLRADVMIWDTHDRRHNVRKRDDIENLARMYHHLLNGVLAQRWPEDAVWTARPDENTALTWERVADFLQLKERRPNTDAPRLWEPGRRRFYLLQLQPARSHEEPLIQLADVFAGMGAYSRLRYPAYKAWVTHDPGQQSLWETLPQSRWSAADRERFQVLRAFNDACKARRFRVSLETHAGLRTMDPRSPVNFWWYEPQHPFDRAPTHRTT
jgi:hypothetical protein